MRNFIYHAGRFLFHRTSNLADIFAIFVVAKLAESVQVAYGVWLTAGFGLLAIIALGTLIRYFEGMFFIAFAVEIQRDLVRALNRAFKKDGA